jgi:nicotinate phosphoribosyltransferase
VIHETSLPCAYDLYQISMAASYHTLGISGQATFDLYVRELPPHRSFLMAAGLDPVLELLEGWRFSPEEISFLRDVPMLRHIPREFFDRVLPEFRFTGEVWAVEEGTAVFPPAPFLRVTAPIAEAQMVETTVLACVGFATSVASRAARVVAAAAGRPVAEFGSRRAHGPPAACAAARAAILAGCSSTSNVSAASQFDLPISGTMAHSWVSAFPREIDAFRGYCEVFQSSAALILDTYDPIAAARAIAESGLHPASVRLDSGDLAELSRTVRGIFDAAGLGDTKILVSGDLDEWRITDLVSSRAPIDGFGVGAALSAVTDAPSLGAVYKLAELDCGRGPRQVMKLAAGKRTLPGSKQVWRQFEGGQAVGDAIGLAQEPKPPGGEPLLNCVMTGGRRIRTRRSVMDLRHAARLALESLPASLRTIQANASYSVTCTPTLQALIARVSTELPREQQQSLRKYAENHSRPERGEHSRHTGCRPTRDPNQDVY